MGSIKLVNLYNELPEMLLDNVDKTGIELIYVSTYYLFAQSVEISGFETKFIKCEFIFKFDVGKVVN